MKPLRTLFKISVTQIMAFLQHVHLHGQIIFIHLLYFFLSCPPTHLSFDGSRDLSLSCFSLSSFLQVLELIMLWPKSICVVCHVLLVRGVWPEASTSSLIRHLTTCFHTQAREMFEIPEWFINNVDDNQTRSSLLYQLFLKVTYLWQKLLEGFNCYLQTSF